MSNNTSEDRLSSTKKHRRTHAEVRKEHEEFVNLYRNGLTHFEIMRMLNISKVQYKKHFADVILEQEITLESHTYGTCFGKHIPNEIRSMIQANKEDILRFELYDTNSVILYKHESHNAKQCVN